MTAKPAGRLGFTPVKIAIIAGLSVVLIATVIYEFAGSSAPTQPIRKRATAGSNNPEGLDGSTVELKNDVEPRVENGRWPDLAVEEVASFDPFAFPETLALRRLQPGYPSSSIQSSNSKNGQSPSTLSPAYPDGKIPISGGQATADSRPQELKRRLEEQRAVAAELQRRGVGMILRTSTGAVAHIGDLQLRVGDVLNGLRVAEIGQDGIRLVPENGEIPKPGIER